MEGDQTSFPEAPRSLLFIAEDKGGARIDAMWGLESGGALHAATTRTRMPR